MFTKTSSHVADSAKSTRYITLRLLPLVSGHHNLILAEQFTIWAGLEISRQELILQILARKLWLQVIGVRREDIDKVIAIEKRCVGTNTNSGKKHPDDLLLVALIEKIACLRKQAENTIRDVWRFTHPLTAAWNRINPLRNNPSVQHWGVLVAETDRETVETARNHRKELKKKRKGWGLGVIHELARVGKLSAYRVSKWMSNMIKKGFKLMRVGKTDLKNEQILSKGIFLA